MTCGFLAENQWRSCDNYTTFKLEKWRYLPHYLSDKSLKGTVVNRTEPYIKWNYTKTVKRVLLEINWSIQVLLLGQLANTQVA